jgi:hypothetical protein
VRCAAVQGTLLANLTSKLKLCGLGRIVLACPGDATFPHRTGSTRHLSAVAVLLVFWLFYLKEKVTDGKQTGTEHTRLIPQHCEERQVSHYDLSSQRR